MVCLILTEIVTVIIYDVFILHYYKRLFPVKRGHWLYYTAVVALNVSAYLIADIWNWHQIGVFLVIGSMMLAFKILFHMNGLQILYSSIIIIFSFYSSRGIVVSIYAMLLSESINGVLQQEGYYYTILMLSVFTSILTNILIRNTILPDIKAKLLLSNNGQLRFAVIYLSFLLVYLLLINDGRFWESRHLWFAVLYLVSCFMSKVGLLLVLNHSVRVIGLMEYEIHTRLLKEQLKRQLRHYKSYQKYTESFSAFKHDYKNMMASVKTLLKNHEIEKAIKLIEDIHETMQKSVLTHNAYSNNILLDAMLQDAANACEEQHIRFSAMVHIPEGTSLTDLDIVRVFTNVITNAIEACCKVEDISKRFIEVKGNESKDWIYVEILNSYHGEIKFKNEELPTTKPNKEFHGIGLKIVNDIMEGLGGLVLIDIDRVKVIFTMKLHIPRH